MGLDYNMDSRNAHFGMFDQMDSHHLYSNQLAELQSDISVLEERKNIKNKWISQISSQMIHKLWMDSYSVSIQYVDCQRILVDMSKAHDVISIHIVH